jgi:radical SAM superfamily enzyme YgiQ (UPF0313 family)
MAQKNIVLVYPIISKNIKFHWMPTSLLTISSKLVSHGYPVQIIDERIYNRKEFEKKVIKVSKTALLVGFSVMTGYQIHGAVNISKIIKSFYPNLHIVWGGDHPTIAPEQVLHLPFVDMVVKGQGEETLFEVVNRLEKKKELDGIKGLCFKKDKKIIINCSREFHEIDSYYPLPYHLLNIKPYINPDTKAFNYYTSAGCVPGRCAFCNTAYNFNGWKSVAPNKVVSQIKQLVDKYKFVNCKFQDSNFFVNEKRVIEICRLFLKKNINIKWNASGRADQLLRYNYTTLELMVKAGCICLFIGMESGSQRMLNKMCKMMKASDMLNFAKKVKDLPIELHLSLIFGLPGESVNDLKITARMVEKIKSVNSRVKFQKCFFTPYPSTPFYNEAIKLGYVPPKDIYGWINIEESSDFVDVPWMPDKIKKEYQRLFEKYFKKDKAKTKFN